MMEHEDEEFRLDPAMVEEAFKDCLYDTKEEAEADPNAVQVEGIVFNAVLNPLKLEEWQERIVKMLMELPDNYRQSGGGGWSFLNACDDRHGNQWTGLHQTMSMLFILGEGIGKVKSVLPRDMWSALPGGMPYYVILDKQPEPVSQSDE
jgi:hypothetical protein